MATPPRVPADDSALLLEQSRELRAQARRARAHARELCDEARATIQRADAVATCTAAIRRLLKSPHPENSRRAILTK